MIKANPTKYAEAQRRIQDGVWTVDHEAGAVYRSDGRRLGTLDQCGYLNIRTKIDGRCFNLMLHRVIWESAHGPIPEGKYVNHLDGNKTNNALANLELVTHLDNMRHAWANGLRDGVKGERHSAAKLTLEQVREIYARVHNGETGLSLAAEFGISKAAVSEIKRRTTWARDQVA